MHNGYANLLQELGRYIESEWHYKKSIDADSKLASVYNNYGVLLEELNRKVDAGVQYKKAIDLDSDYMVAHYNYAALLVKLNRKDESEEHCIKVIDAIKEIDANLNFAGMYNIYANLLREHEKFHDAEKMASIALKIAQDDSSMQGIIPYSHATLGDIFANEGCYEDAEREYQRALDKSNSMDNSSISEIHNNLGWVYAQMRKCKKAKDEFKKARNLDSMNIKAKRNLRALARIRLERVPEDLSTIQIFLGGVLFSLLIIAYRLFFISMLSEVFFVAQTIFILLFIFILFNIISKAKFDKNGIDVERSAGHMYMLGKPSTEDSKLEFEHSQLPRPTSTSP